MQSPDNAHEIKATSPETASYRLQYNESNGEARLDLKQIREQLPYLKLMGISTIYLAPIMKAASGSTHRYDGVDLNDADVEGLMALREEADRLGMRIMADFVPNHMHTGPENKWWEDLLIWGRESIHEAKFEVDWEKYDGKLLLPNLGNDLYDLIKKPLLPEDYQLDLDRSTGRFRLVHGPHVIDLGTDLIPDILRTGQAGAMPPDSVQKALADLNASQNETQHYTALHRLSAILKEQTETMQSYLHNVLARYNDGGRFKNVATEKAALFNRMESAPSHYKLTLHFDDQTGKLLLRYYDNYFPLAPETFSDLLEFKKDEQDQPPILSMEKPGEIRTRLAIIGDKGQPIEKRREDAEGLYSTIKAGYQNQPEFRQKITALLDHFNGPEGRDALDALQARQNYQLSHWKLGLDGIAHRRFFNVNSLAGVRQEDPEVFEATHKLLFKLIEMRAVRGLRFDHVDGLADPRGYLERVRERISEILPPEEAESFRIVVEKITEGDEKPRQDWDAHGTTGYDALNVLNGLSVNESAHDDFAALTEEFTGEKRSFDDLLLDAKNEIFIVELQSELNILTGMARKIATHQRRDLDQSTMKDSTRRIMKYLPVYRTYIEKAHLDVGKIPDADRRIIEEAAGKARDETPSNSDAVDFIKSILTGDVLKNDTFRPAPGPDGSKESDLPALVWDFVRRFQQTSGPLMAIAKENTLFFRHPTLISLNEVGGDPEKFGTSNEEFHRQNAARQQERSLETTSINTHDTKRGDMTRALINAATNLPEEWAETLRAWRIYHDSPDFRAQREDGSFAGPTPADELHIYQTLIGAVPVHIDRADHPDLPAALDRIKAYTVKALREAKLKTNWVESNHEYENACTDFIDRLMTPSETNWFLSEFFKFRKPLIATAAVSHAASRALHILSPGIPDIYQGTELFDHAQALTDPDNRRPVDFEKRSALARNWLENGVDLADLTRNYKDGRVSAFIQLKSLRARLAAPDLFMRTPYTPLEVSGGNKADALAFKYQDGDRIVMAVTPTIRGEKTRLIDQKTLSLKKVFNAAAKPPETLREKLGAAFKQLLGSVSLIEKPKVQTVRTGLTEGTELVEYYSGRRIKVGKDGEIALADMLGGHLPSALLLDPKTAGQADALAIKDMEFISQPAPDRTETAGPSVSPVPESAPAPA